MIEAALAPMVAASGVLALAGAISWRADPRILSAVDGRDAPPRWIVALARLGDGVVAQRLVRIDHLSARRSLARTRIQDDELRILKAVLATVSIATFLPAPFPTPLLSPVAGALGFVAPDIAIARFARRRLRLVEAEIPLLLDALSSAALAGLPPQQALRRAAEVVDGPLAEELDSMLRDVELGARWRDRLEGLGRTIPLPDLERAVALLARAGSLGTSFAGQVATLAARARRTRRATMSERARTAPVKMLFPLVFLVLPAFLLLTVVPLLVATLDSIR